MRSLFSLFLLAFSLNQSSFAQMSCAEELLSCTNGCVAGGLLGALVTKGNSAAATAAQSCSIDCETRNAACTRREEEAAIRQQRIDAERAAVEARRQAAERRQREISDQQNEQKLARQSEINQVVDRTMARAAKELQAIKTLMSGIAPSNVKPPSELKPAVVLATAKQLEDTDPLVARKLYLQLADRKDEYGKTAANALLRFRDVPGDKHRKVTLLGEPPAIVASVTPKKTLEKLAGMRIASPDVVSSNLRYFKQGNDKSISINEFRSIGDGYVYKTYKDEFGTDSHAISILGGLVNLVSYEARPYADSKRTLIDLSTAGNPFIFDKGNEFSYTYSQQVISKSKQGGPGINAPEKYHADCVTTENSAEIAIIECKRKHLLAFNGQKYDGSPPSIAKYAYIHKINAFTIIKTFELTSGNTGINWDSYEIEPTQ